MYSCSYSRSPASPVKCKSSPQGLRWRKLSDDDPDDIGMDIEENLVSIQEEPLEGAYAFAHQEDEAQYR